jgi:hypothetical protein
MPVEVLSVQTLDVQNDVALNSALKAPNGGREPKVLSAPRRAYTISRKCLPLPSPISLIISFTGLRNLRLTSSFVTNLSSFGSDRCEKTAPPVY